MISDKHARETNALIHFYSKLRKEKIIYYTFILPSVTRIDPPAHFVSLRIDRASSRSRLKASGKAGVPELQSSMPEVSAESATRSTNGGS